MFLGLRTVIYPAPDLAASKDWFTTLLGIEPYFDQPFYVGYQVAGYELALDPHGDVQLGPVTYWGVPDADSALQQLVESGAAIHGEVQEVGDSIRVATVRVPGSDVVLGIIENPHFALADPPVEQKGPGR